MGDLSTAGGGIGGGGSSEEINRRRKETVKSAKTSYTAYTAHISHHLVAMHLNLFVIKISLGVWIYAHLKSRQVCWRNGVTEGNKEENSHTLSYFSFLY